MPFVELRVIYGRTPAMEIGVLNTIQNYWSADKTSDIDDSTACPDKIRGILRAIQSFGGPAVVRSLTAVPDQWPPH